MSLRPLRLDRRAALEEQAGPHGVNLAVGFAERAHEAIKGFPASTETGRSAICQLTADQLIAAAAQEIGVAADELPDND